MLSLPFNCHNTCSLSVYVCEVETNFPAHSTCPYPWTLTNWIKDRHLFSTRVSIFPHTQAPFNALRFCGRCSDNRLIEYWWIQLTHGDHVQLWTYTQHSTTVQQFIHIFTWNNRWVWSLYSVQRTAKCHWCLMWPITIHWNVASLMSPRPPH